MTFSAARVAQGAIARRKLRIGAAIPAIVGFTVAGGFFSTEMIITPPAGAVGDLIILHLARRTQGEDPPYVQTAGETLAQLWLGDETGLASIGFFGGWRIRTGSDTTYTFSVPGGDNSSSVCYALSGHDPTTPIIDFSEVQGASGSVVIPAVSSDISKCMLLHLPALTGTTAGAAITAPGSAESEDHNERHGTTTGVTHAAAREDFVAGGGTGTRTWTTNGAHKFHGALVLIAPIEISSDNLEFEATTDNLLFEDASGVLQLE